MATLSASTPSRKIQHYASYLLNGHEVYGIATMVPGGYAFCQDGDYAVRLVSYKDVDLMLYGVCAIADAQAELDGDLVHKASRTLQRVA